MSTDQNMYTARREIGPNPQGEDYADLFGQWVVRDMAGFYITHNKYRNDLVARYPNLVVIDEDAMKAWKELS